MNNQTQQQGIYIHRQRQLKYSHTNCQFQIIQQETYLNRFNNIPLNEYQENSSQDESNYEDQFQQNDDSYNEQKSDDNDYNEKNSVYTVQESDDNIQFSDDDIQNEQYSDHNDGISFEESANEYLSDNDIADNQEDNNEIESDKEMSFLIEIPIQKSNDKSSDHIRQQNQNLKEIPKETNQKVNSQRQDNEKFTQQEMNQIELLKQQLQELQDKLEQQCISLQKLQQQNSQPPQQQQQIKPSPIKLPQIPTHQQQQQQLEVQQTPKKQQILPVLPQSQNQINQVHDRILIYNQVFYQQKNGLNQNKTPCKHLKCQSLAYLDSYGMVTCQSMCKSFSIIETMFDNFNNVFQRGECTGQYNFLKNTIFMAQFVNDSLGMSNKNENQKDMFLKQFANVLFQMLKSRKD